MPNSSHDVIIVGAGLAGLRAAQVLKQAGRDVLLIEASDHVGGRVRSYTIDGFIIDQGFQLINPSYPELRASGALTHLDLRRFEPVLRFQGAATAHELVDPRFAPGRALRALRHPQLSVGDAWRLARLLAGVAFASPGRLTRGADCSTRDGLVAEGITDDAIHGVLQPFLRGVLLDEALDTSWHYTQIILQSFVRGRPGTPAAGVQALPQALLAATSVPVRYDESTRSVTADTVTTNHGHYRASSVIVACDASTTSALLGRPAPAWRAQTAYWCALPAQRDTAQLRIDAVRGLWNTLDIASVAPERAPRGQSLIVASAVGEVDDPSVRDDVARLYGVARHEVSIIERQVVHRALPVLKRPLDLHRAIEDGGIVLAGDYLHTPSIQGALVSGRRAAEVVLGRGRA